MASNVDDDEEDYMSDAFLAKWYVRWRTSHWNQSWVSETDKHETDENIEILYPAGICQLICICQINPPILMDVTRMVSPKYLAERLGLADGVCPHLLGVGLV